jgi:hypothetical protein
LKKAVFLKKIARRVKSERVKNAGFTFGKFKKLKFPAVNKISVDALVW